MKKLHMRNKLFKSNTSLCSKANCKVLAVARGITKEENTNNVATNVTKTEEVLNRGNHRERKQDE